MKSDDPVEITVTVKIPPELVLDMQKAALQAQIEGGMRMQEGLIGAWTGIWSEAAGAAQKSFLQMFQVPPVKSLTERKK